MASETMANHISFVAGSRAAVPALLEALRPLAALAAMASAPDVVADNEALVHFAGHYPLTWGDVRRAAAVVARAEGR